MRVNFGYFGPWLGGKRCTYQLRLDMVQTNEILTKAVRMIKDANARLGHDLGWSFTLSPSSALVPDPPMMIVGLNPGGKSPRPIRISSEEGNRLKFPPPPDQPDKPFRLQLCALFKLIASAIGSPNAWGNLLDSTPTLNFCPFRMKWPPKRSRAETIEFCRSWWDYLASQVQPHVIICVGKEAYDEIMAAYCRIGFTVKPGKFIRTGWGDTCFRYRFLTGPTRTSVIFRLPHVSWVKVFEAEKYRIPCERLARRIAENLLASVSRH